MPVCSHGLMRDFSSLWILVVPHSLVAFSGKGRGLFYISWVSQNTNSRDEPWVWAPGKSHQVLGFVRRGIPGLQFWIMVVKLRGIV